MKAIALLMLLLCGCSLSFEEARLASQAKQRLGVSIQADGLRATCASIDRERAWFGAFAAVSVACSAGTGVPAVVDVVSSPDVKTGLQITMAVCAVTAAGLIVLRDAAGSRWVASGCGQ